MFPSFFTAIAPTEIYTLSLHDALPILKVVAPYLDSSDIERIREAYKLADEAHLVQFRSSGEPYITHPIAVAAICGRRKLDEESPMVALLHDIIECQYVCKQEIEEKFSTDVAEIVDGVTKLERLHVA